MADEILKSDPNRVRTIGGVTDDSSQEVRNIRVDPSTVFPARAGMNRLDAFDFCVVESVPRACGDEPAKE